MCDEEYKRSREEFSRIINEKFEKLSPREKDVLNLRFGLKDGKTRTLQEVGKHFSLTAQEIRLIEAAALRKIRTRGDDNKAGATVPKKPLKPDDETSMEISFPENSDDSSDN